MTDLWNLGKLELRLLLHTGIPYCKNTPICYLSHYSVINLINLPGADIFCAVEKHKYKDIDKMSKETGEGWGKK